MITNFKWAIRVGGEIETKSTGHCKNSCPLSPVAIKSAMEEKQEEIILHFISGQDIFVSLSTSYGKSLIFESYLWFMATTHV